MNGAGILSELGAWNVLVWLASVLGLGGLAAWYFKGFLFARFPKLAPERLGRLAAQRDLPLPSGDRFAVLIADLQGDDEQKSHTRHVAAALEPYQGLDVHRIGPGPEWNIGARDESEAAARKLLAERRGDVLVSGDVATKDKALRLRILPADPDLRPQARVPEGRRPGEYALTETGLPLDFDQNFNAVLVALVATGVAPATERQGQYLADILSPLAGQLKHLCTHMPPGLTEEQRGSLWHALGLAASTLGEQRGENEWLDDAVGAFRAALEVRTREAVPLDWAMTQNNLGNALLRLSERADRPDRLEEAVGAFRAALEVRTREAVPLDWAMTQNNLGNALASLGERADRPDRLEEAVEAYRAALEVFRPAGASHYVAGTENNLARAEALLAERHAEGAAAGTEGATAAPRR